MDNKKASNICNALREACKSVSYLVAKEEPLDGDQTEEFTMLFGLYLDEMNGNITQAELIEGLDKILFTIL